MDDNGNFEALYKEAHKTTVPTIRVRFEYGDFTPANHPDVLLRNPWHVDPDQSDAFSVMQLDGFLPYPANPTIQGAFGETPTQNGGLFLGAGNPSWLEPPYYSLGFPRQVDHWTMDPKTESQLAVGDWFLFDTFKDQNTHFVADPQSGDPGFPDLGLYDTRAAIFGSATGWLYAEYKGHLVSSLYFSTIDSRGPTSPNSQRKIDWIESQTGIQTIANGVYQQVYESASGIWYTHSTDMGLSWTKELDIGPGERPAISAGYSSSCIAYYFDGDIEIKKITGGSAIEQIATIDWLVSDDAAPAIVYDDVQGTIFAVWERHDGTLGYYVDYGDGNPLNWFVEESGQTGHDAVRPTIGHKPGSTEYHLAWREGTQILYSAVELLSSPWATIHPPEIISNAGQNAYGPPTATVDCNGNPAVAWSGSNYSHGAFINFRQRIAGNWGGFATMLAYPNQAYWLPSITGVSDVSADQGLRIAHNVDCGMIGVLKLENVGGLSTWSIPAHIQTPLFAMHPNLVEYAPQDYLKQVSSAQSAQYPGILSELSYTNEHLAKSAKSTTLSSSREVILRQDTSSIAVRVGEITVRSIGVDEGIDWGSGFDSLIVGRTKTVAEYVKTKPFVVPANGQLRLRIATDRNGSLQSTQSLLYSIEIVDAATGATLSTPHSLAPNAMNNGRMDAQFNSSMNALAGKTVFVRMTLSGRDSTITIVTNDYFHDPNVTIPKAIEESAANTPLTVGMWLGQNYPNPFNPLTEIPFSLNEPMNIRLVVLDVFGRELIVLKDGVCDAGYHVASFDGAEYPSGTYIVRLESGRGSLTERMMLLK